MGTETHDGGGGRIGRHTCIKRHTRTKRYTCVKRRAYIKRHTYTKRHTYAHGCQGTTQVQSQNKVKTFNRMTRIHPQQKPKKQDTLTTMHSITDNIMQKQNRKIHTQQTEGHTYTNGRTWNHRGQRKQFELRVCGSRGMCRPHRRCDRLYFCTSSVSFSVSAPTCPTSFSQVVVCLTSYSRTIRALQSLFACPCSVILKIWFRSRTPSEISSRRVCVGPPSGCSTLHKTAYTAQTGQAATPSAVDALATRVLSFETQS